MHMKAELHKKNTLACINNINKSTSNFSPRFATYSCYSWGWPLGFKERILRCFGFQAKAEGEMTRQVHMEAHNLHQTALVNSVLPFIDWVPTPLAKLAGRDQKKIKLKILGISWLCISTA